MDGTPAADDGQRAASITLEGIGKRYPDGTEAVRDLSLHVEAGELVVLIGPSGCGKSTVLRMINRLIEPTSGRILLGDSDVTRADPVRLRRRIGYVIQNVGLFPHQTVAANVATVPRLLGWASDRARSRVEELLELVGLDPGQFGRRYPHELSGGQRQRVGVARALAADPVVLLMDEPFSAVDPIVRTRLQEEFLRLQATVRKTIILVTHDLDEAVRLGDRIAVLSQGADWSSTTPREPCSAPPPPGSSASSSAPIGESAGWWSPRSPGRCSRRCPARMWPRCRRWPWAARRTTPWPRCSPRPVRPPWWSPNRVGRSDSCAGNRSWRCRIRPADSSG